MRAISKFLFIAMFLGFVACDKDDEVDITPTGDVLVFTNVPNADGLSGSAYMRVIPDLSSATYDNELAYPVTLGCAPYIVGNDVYIVPGWSMASDILEKYTLTNNKLEKTGSFTLPSQSVGVAVSVKDNIAYVSLANYGKIQMIDHTTMEDLGSIDLSEYGVGDNDPNPAISIIRDDILYVGLAQVVAGYIPDYERPIVDVALIDTKTNEVIKVITSEVGFSMPTHPDIDINSIFMDENNDIYINCVSGYGFIGHKAGYLRIKNGETKFDPDYMFDVTQTDIEGEEQFLSYVSMMEYYGDGIVYANGNINAYYSESPDYFTDLTITPVKIDLKNKTIERLTDIPASCNYGGTISIIDEKVVFGLAPHSDKGYYIYDPVTGEASNGSIIKTDGYPGKIVKF